ncbi:type IV secretory system conjugative DNA transfer family protein [Symmachiella dynata]|nr:hypothetical protein [Symmachiella dynata]
MKDLIVFSPDGPWRFDFLDYEMRQGGHTRNITRLIMTIGETLRSSDHSASENSDFWEREQERMLYNAVQIIKVATGKVTAPDLQRFIGGAANGAEEISSESWQTGFHHQCIRAAYLADKSAVDTHDCQLAFDYWLSELPRMASKTKSSIEVGVNGILHVFNTGITRSLVSGGTNVSPDDMFDRKWVMVNMAPAAWGDIGSFINAGWKYLTQKAILRRDATEGDSINVIWCDEAQQFVNSFDSQYLAQCRSHLGCMVFLTQSLSSLYSVLKGPAGRHQADALMANFGHTIIHACDPISAEWASSKLGKTLQTFIGGSMAPTTDLWDDLKGHSQYTGSFSEHYESVVQPNVFMNGLRTGGHVNGLMCDAILLRNGQPFSNGQNWLNVSFSQM